jgi:hypothetical protein
LHKAGELLLTPPDRGKEPLLGVYGSRYVLAIATALVAFSPPVVATETGHISPVPNTDYHVRLQISHQVPNPFIAVVIMVRMGVTIWDD